VGVPVRFRIRPPLPAGEASSVERTIDVEPTVGAITLGRRAGVAIQLPFATISALHARVAGGPGRWTIEDLGSANGTFLRERRLVPGHAQRLVEGDVLRLADVTVVFEGEAADLGRSPGGLTESTGSLARRLVSDLFGACRPAEVVCLVVEEGPDAGQSIDLAASGRSYRVGRAADCDLVLTDDDVSREHATFERRWDGVEVRDLDSKNGVKHEGQGIEGPRRLRDGETVVLGRTRLRLDDPEDRYLRQMQDEDGRRTMVPGPGTRSPPEASAVDPPDEPSPDAPPPAPPPAGRGGWGPGVIAGLALLVLAGIGAFVAWFLVGPWK
jgi:pSer/pThr/pTyr-binding forkhead associated (FHA) protein